MVLPHVYASMDFSEILDVLTIKFQLAGNFKWKDKQIECLRAIYEKKDFLCILPTGYGKSLIFQAVPFIHALQAGEDVDCSNKIVVVISPLNSIIENQLASLADKEINACTVDYSAEEGHTLEHDFDARCKIKCAVPLPEIEGNYNIIYAHPESLLMPQGRQFVKQIRDNICGLVVDEAHMILEWGTDFRKAFHQIGEDLVPLLGKTPIMLFTATATKDKLQEMSKIMMMKEPKLIEMNPNRPNIYYEKEERPPSTQTQDHLDAILEDISTSLENEGQSYPLTIFYTDTTVIAYCYRYMEVKFGSNQYVGEAIPENRIFAQYHREYTEDLKEHIVQEICKSNSKIRIVFATVGLGLGLDASGVRRVIHYKPPTSLEQYFQETGRAGRDGEQATAMLYYNNSDIRRNRPGIKKGIIDYCKTQDQCLRDQMLSHFGYSAPANRSKNNCCCICKQ